jgi:fatty acid amide hydrolase
MLGMRVLTDQGSRPFRTPDQAGLRRLRIGFYTDNGVMTPSPAIRRAVTQAARALEAQGLVVEEWQPPNVDLMWRIYFALLLAGGLAKARLLSRGSELSWNVRQALLTGILPGSAFRVAAAVLSIARQSNMANGVRYCAEQYDRLLERRARCYSDFIEAMDVSQIDAILCPVFPTPALHHRVSPFIHEGLSYVSIYNLLGMPAGVVAATRVDGNEETDDRRSAFSFMDRAARRVEAGSAGLPVGVQVVARHWREDIVLGVMSLLEEHFRGQPGYPLFTSAGGGS